MRRYTLNEVKKTKTLGGKNIYVTREEKEIVRDIRKKWNRLFDFTDIIELTPNEAYIKKTLKHDETYISSNGLFVRIKRTSLLPSNSAAVPKSESEEV